MFGVWLAAAWGQSALPESPSPARQCAEAATGTEIDVCLKLATLHPEEADSVAAALRAHIDRGSSDDRELMFALLLLLSEGTGTLGAEALAELGDPRAVPPLVHAVETRAIPIGLGCVDALAAYRTGLPHLSRWLLDKERPLEIRIASAQALGRLERPEAADALIDSVRRRGLPGPLRQAILQSIQDNHPNRFDEVVNQVSQDGTVWLTVSGAASLGYVMAVIAESGQVETAGAGALAGTIAGGTVGYLIGQAAPMEAGDAAFVTTNGLVGTAAGLALGAGMQGKERRYAGMVGLGGEAVGLGLGLALAKPHRGSPQDSIEAALFGLATGGVAAGALSVGVDNGLSDPSRSGRNPPLVGLGIGLLAGTTFGHAVAPGIEFRGNDWALIGISAGVGTALGAFAPLEENERGALPFVGLAAGAMTGFVLAGTVDAEWDALGSGALGGVYGGLIAGGTAAWIAPENRTLVGGAVLTGGLVGLGAGGLLADLDQDPIDDRDLMLTLYVTGWTAANTAVMLQIQEDSPTARIGPLLVLPAASGAVISGLAPVLDVPVTHSSAALSLGLWGTYVGGTVGQLVNEDPLPLGLVGGNAGLLTGTVLLSPWVGMPPTTVALADAGGILGGASGLAVGRVTNGGEDALLLGSLVGAGVGFAGGALVGQALRKTGATRNIAFHKPNLPPITLVPSALEGKHGPVYGAVLQVHGW